MEKILQPKTKGVGIKNIEIIKRATLSELF